VAAAEILLRSKQVFCQASPNFGSQERGELAEEVFTMATAATDAKQQAHELIDAMAPGQVSAVVGLLRIMVDPVARRLASIPYEDEPIGEEEERAVAAARASLARGEGIPHEEVLREFGLTMDDWERMGRTPIEEPFVPGQ
jgi:hypothetical protein